ncbi:MAG TPA: 50S ribosomal protein L4 [bacterium]|nr:50S ribosomal protein L4 [bacterium]
METLKVVDKHGRAAGEVAVSEKLRTARANPQLLHDVITGYRRNRRAGTASTLTKGEVAGSGKKPWRQKGTGRARAGYRRSPVWRGGGATFGPKPRDFGRSIPKALRRKALAAAFADKVRGGEIVLVDAVARPAKTKEMAGWLKTIGAANAPLIVLGAPDPAVERATRNIPGASVAQRGALSAWLLMAHGAVVMARGEFEFLQERL